MWSALSALFLPAPRDALPSPSPHRSFNWPPGTDTYPYYSARLLDKSPLTFLTSARYSRACVRRFTHGTLSVNIRFQCMLCHLYILIDRRLYRFRRNTTEKQHLRQRVPPPNFYRFKYREECTEKSIYNKVVRIVSYTFNWTSSSMGFLMSSRTCNNTSTIIGSSDEYAKKATIGIRDHHGIC